MFYLLDDNSIIDSEELKRKLHLDAKLGIIDNELIVTLENFPIFRSESKIKKQSENVYDLIENGDIVNYYGNLYEVKKIEFIQGIVYMDTAIGLCMPSVTRFMELLKAIYKPDEKGNYIKAWEKKENEKED